MYIKLLKEFLEIDDVITILHKRFFERYKKNKNLKIVEGNENIEKILEDILNENNIDYALIIAPEEENILYNLTKILEKYKIKNLGSSSKAIKIAGDKYLMYKKLKDIVNIPKTWLGRYIIKKRDGCGGEFKFIDESYIIQEYVEGESLSVSSIVGKNKIYFLSLNRQFINCGYKGGEININHPKKGEIFKEVEKCLKNIEGLFGYVGVDVVVNDDIHIVDINPRITTSVYKLYTIPTLAKLLIKNINNEELYFTVSGGTFKL